MAGKTSTPRSADSQIQGDTAKICLIAAETMIWQDLRRNGIFGKSLEAQQG